MLAIDNLSLQKIYETTLACKNEVLDKHWKFEEQIKIVDWFHAMMQEGATLITLNYCKKRNVYQVAEQKQFPHNSQIFEQAE